MKKLLLSLLVWVCIAVSAQAQIVITELMYNPPEAGIDSLEYLELYNTSDTAVVLDAYTIVGVDYVFLNDTVQPGQYYLLCKSSSAMLSVFGITADQWVTGSLSNAGEAVVIRDAAGNAVDSVAYTNAAPWPTETNGFGSSLELCNLAADNALVTFWSPAVNPTGANIGGFDVLGTPGAPNTVACNLVTADYIVEVADFTFTPADITIFVGESVGWNFSSGTHNVNGSLATFPSNPEGFYSGDIMPAPYGYAYTFTIPGVYTYQSDGGEGMTGTVTVIQPPFPNLMITEIMYKDPFQTDSLEFVELYNFGTDTVLLNGIVVSNAVNYTFTDGTVAPGEYILLARYASVLTPLTTAQVFEWPAAGGGGPGGGQSLSNQGETITLTAADGTLIDEVAYMPGTPWPAIANDVAISLSLCDLAADNSDPANWGLSADALATSYDFVTQATPGFGSVCSVFTLAGNNNANFASGEVGDINLLGNDYVPGGVASVTVYSEALNGIGTYTLTDGVMTFAADTLNCGFGTLVYQVCDSLGNCDTASVFINVACPIYYPTYTVGQVTTNDFNGVADSMDVTCQLEGTVYGVNLSTNGIRFTLIDDLNEGIGVFAQNQNSGYVVTEGDRVIVRGAIGQQGGVTTLLFDSIALVTQGNTLFDPTETDFFDETTESQLIRLATIVTMVDTTQWGAVGGGPGGGGFSVDVTDGTNFWVVRIDNNVDLFTMPSPPSGALLRITGLGSQMDNQQPLDSGYVIMPRYAPDIEIVTNTEAPSPMSVQVSPNPARNIVTVATETSMDAVVITDALGRRVLYRPIGATNATVEVANLPAGVYTLTVFSGAQRTATKFVKL